MAEPDSPQRHREHGVGKGDADPTPPGNSDGYQNKELAGKAIRKNMKTKGGQNPDCSGDSEASSSEGDLRNHGDRESEGYTHPRCFGKRGCKLLKTNDGSCKKRGKRVQEAASY
jgi:hypothetical protein